MTVSGKAFALLNEEADSIIALGELRLAQCTARRRDREGRLKRKGPVKPQGWTLPLIYIPWVSGWSPVGFTLGGAAAGNFGHFGHEGGGRTDLFNEKPSPGGGAGSTAAQNVSPFSYNPPRRL